MESIKNQMKQKVFKEVELHKSAGILDDFAVRKNVATREGTVEKVPVNNSDITNKLYVDTAVAAIHTRQHSITQTLDHTSTATSGQMLKANANGLPVNATNTDAQVAAAVTASHAEVHNMASHSDDNNYTITTSGGASIHSPTFFIETANNRVGIGTLDPATTLDVNGNITATGGTSTGWNTAYTHSQIAGGDSVHVSVAENTSWDGAATHAANNSQAHTDYLKNDASDTSTGTITADGFTVAATKKVILDSATSTTFITERADGITQIAGCDVEIDAAKKLYLDDTDHHSYIVESADGIVDVYAGAVNAIKCTAGTVTMPSQPSGRQYRNAAYTLVKNVATKLPFDAENYDTGGNFLSGTYTTPVAGRYLITGGVNFGSTEDQKAYQVQIRVDGSIATYGAMQGTGTGGIVCAVTDIQNIAANKTIELWYYHNGVADVACGTLTSTTWLAVTLLN